MKLSFNVGLGDLHLHLVMVTSNYRVSCEYGSVERAEFSPPTEHLKKKKRQIDNVT